MRFYLYAILILGFAVFLYSIYDVYGQVPDPFPANGLVEITTSTPTIPIITLLGISPQSVLEKDVYVDAGATAFDTIDGDITKDIVTKNPVDTSVLGQYTITYDVTDSSGLSAIQVTRIVNVISTPDTTPPDITLLGSSTIDIKEKDVYVDAGATAFDDIDGDITANIVTKNTVDTSIAGTYFVFYDVSDSSGNAAKQVIRTVNVISSSPTSDKTPPVITLIGKPVLDVIQKDLYVDNGATAFDDVDGDITKSIVTKNPVDTTILGQYIITYDVSDSAGNPAIQVTRTINVVEPTIPIPDVPVIATIDNSTNPTTEAAKDVFITSETAGTFTLVDPNNLKVSVVDNTKKTDQVIDQAKQDIVTQIQSGFHPRIDFGTDPVDIYFDPSNGQITVKNSVTGEVQVVDVGIAFSSLDSKTVTSIDPKVDKAYYDIPLSDQKVGIGFDPNGILHISNFVGSMAMIKVS